MFVNSYVNRLFKSLKQNFLLVIQFWKKHIDILYKRFVAKVFELIRKNSKRLFFYFTTVLFITVTLILRNLKNIIFQKNFRLFVITESMHVGSLGFVNHNLSLVMLARS